MVEWREINHRWGKFNRQILVCQTDYTIYNTKKQSGAGVPPSTYSLLLLTFYLAKNRPKGLVKSEE